MGDPLATRPPVRVALVDGYPVAREGLLWAALPVLLLTASISVLLLHAAARIGEALTRRAGGGGNTVAVCFRPADDAVLSRAALHFLRSRAPPALLVV